MKNSYFYRNWANDIWGWTDPLNQDEYAIVGLNCGSSFVRMTDPENPVVVAYLPTQLVHTNTFMYLSPEASPVLLTIPVN